MSDTRDELDRLLADLDRAGVLLVAAGDRLRFKPAKLPGDLLARVKAHKADLLAEATEHHDHDLLPGDLPACERCGSLELWQSIGSDQWRCRRCDPPRLAMRVLEHVARIRRRETQ